MKSRFIKCLSFLWLTILIPMVPGAAVQPPPEGGVLPEIVLPVPENPSQRKYLGLDAPAPREFKIPQIQAQVVIIEIFSMY